jgi:hypothetical protein
MKLKDIKKISLAILKKWPQLSLGVLALFLFLALIITIALSSSFFTEKINIFIPGENILKLQKHIDKEVEKYECKDCHPNPLTGVKQKQEFGFPVAVIIDNHIDARPPASLSQAHIVYELPVEGSITRYLAIYDSKQEIATIGPVRSARPYMLDYVQELSALFVHVGGSPQALVNIAQDNIFNLNEFYNGSYFLRDENRPKPHHIFINFADATKYIKEKNQEEASFSFWKFQEDSENIDKEDKELVTNINIDFGSDAYEVNWVYDFEKNNYLRTLNDKVHVDDRNIDIRARNIIIHITNSVVLDEKLRLKVDTIGGGEAVICFEAKCQEGTWKKDSAKTRTLYYIDGKEVKFSPGNFWIEVIDQNAKFTY